MLNQAKKTGGEQEGGDRGRKLLKESEASNKKNPKNGDIEAERKGGEDDGRVGCGHHRISNRRGGVTIRRQKDNNFGGLGISGRGVTLASEELEGPLENGGERLIWMDLLRKRVRGGERGGV